jgi:two-component system, OmpR family, alkaline phosphatase synthesis response regulator PhoP
MKVKTMHKKSRILLVEDEESLAKGLKFNLAEEGYRVTYAPDGQKAIARYESGDFDLVILDVMLPYCSGFEVARRIRDKSPQMPILMLTARTRLQDRVKGLEIGVDDYMTKPFHLKELLLRVRGMLKRKTWYQSSAKTKPAYRLGDAEIRFDNLTAQAGDRMIRLTPHEAMVLKYLIDHKGKVVSRKELLENVWQIFSDVETRTVDNFIVRLRKYFEPDPSNPVFIKSIRSAGYIFTEGSTLRKNKSAARAGSSA